MSAMISQNSAASASATSTSESSQLTAPGGYRLPHPETLQHCAKLGIVEDKPLMMDYWTTSLDKTVLIGIKDTQEKLLVKSIDEYTSPIIKIYKVKTEFIIITENSIYLVDAGIPTKKITT